MSDELITLRIPASVAAEVPVMANRLTDRMHDLLERNNDNQLTGIEKEELEALVEMAQFAELVATAVRKVAP